MVPRRGARERRSASACVRVRFQRHDVLSYAFCFNFLEATGSISLSFSSRALLPFFSLLLLSPSPLPPSLPPPSLSLSLHSVSFPILRHSIRRRCSPSLVGAPRNVPWWFSALWMLLSSSSLLPTPSCPPRLFSHPPTPAPSSPPRPLSPVLLSLLPVYPFPATHSHAATPSPQSKGLNRPVQFPTRSASNPRSQPTIARQSLTLLAHIAAISGVFFFCFNVLRISLFSFLSLSFISPFYFDQIDKVIILSKHRNAFNSVGWVEINDEAINSRIWTKK